MKRFSPSRIAALFQAGNTTLWNLEAYGDNPPLVGHISPRKNILNEYFKWANERKDSQRRKEFKRYFR